MDSNINSVDNKENNCMPNFVPPPTPLLKKIGFGTGKILQFYNVTNAV